MKKIHYLSKEEADRLINSVDNNRHKVAILIMLDAGLRVSEMINLQLANFDFKKREIVVKSLKKQDDDYRIIPISPRLYRALAEYIESKKSLCAVDYLFEGKNGRDYLCRSTIQKFLKKYSKACNIPNLHPHTLRHTFATHHLSAGTSLPAIKTMLGHKRFDTTLIYAEIPQAELHEKINKLNASPPSLWSRLIPRKKEKLINIDFSSSVAIIGRNTELQKIQSHAEKCINTIVIGNIGTGKSTLLSSLKTDKQILNLDNTATFKKSIVNILLYLYKDKNAVLSMLWKDFLIDEAKKRIQRDSVNNLIDLLIQSVQPKEYILLIDDITGITAGARKGIERLKDTFVIIASARIIKASDTSFLWNFEKIEIDVLPRNYALQLISNLSASMEMESIDAFRQHIYDQTNGNPRAIYEMIDRYKKEPFLTLETIREVKHTGALRELDMTWIVVLSLGIVMAMRYMAGELDQPAFRFIGGIAMIMLLMYRPLMATFKKSAW